MKHFFLLLWDNILHSWKTKKGVIFLVLYLAVFGLIAYGFFEVQNQINTELASQGVSEEQRDFMFNFARSVLLVQGDTSLFVEFLLKVPFINIGIFLVSLFGTPILLLILGYDRIAQEAYDGTVRYIISRTSRLSYYLAKFFTGVVECAIITFVALLLILLWGQVMVEGFQFAKSFGYGIRFWFLALPFLSFFVALSQMYSSMFRKPFYALVASFVTMFALILLPIWIPYVSPYDMTYFQGLFYYYGSVLTQTVGMYVIFTLIPLGIGFTVFNKKDL